MSDRLAISAAFSVLMMSIYVLFGSHAARAPLSAENLASPVSISLPEVSVEAGDLLPLRRLLPRE
jgi:hypothetical protein